MNCLSCGTNIGDRLGLCEDCKAALPRKTLPPELALSSEAATRDWKYSPIILALLVLGALVLASYAVAYILKTSKPLEYVVRNTNDAVIVGLKGDTSEVSYAYEKPAWVKTRIYQTNELNKDFIKLTGIALWVMTLQEDEYETWQKDYAHTGRCAASFLNGHIKHYFLVGNSGEVAGELRKLKLETGSKFYFEGSNLRYLGMRENGGELTTPSISIPGGTVLVERFSLEE